MTERALHFERPDLRDTVTLSSIPWSGDRGGLLAGESLILDLQRIELSYLQTNLRQLEIEQSFSLSQFYPEKLIELRETGKCSFDIPEFLFDLYYPGHYFRRIKAVRLTLPCVVGPYTSVGATLRMTRSQLRDQPNANQSLKEIPLRYAPAIAATTAQSDAGVFEFSFRDERLLPFEGTGAISSWTLSLPKTIRPFDYGTISDVILRINYTAREDDALRDAVELNNGSIQERLRVAAPNIALSLRHDFPDVWARFKQSAPSSGHYSFKLELLERHYPFWLKARLHSEETVSLHALLAERPGASYVLRAKVGTGTVLEEMTRKDALDGLWMNKDYPRAKPVTNGNQKVELQISIDQKDMDDLILVIRSE